MLDTIRKSPPWSVKIIHLACESQVCEHKQFFNVVELFGDRKTRGPILGLLVYYLMLLPIALFLLSLYNSKIVPKAALIKQVLFHLPFDGCNSLTIAIQRWTYHWNRPTVKLTWAPSVFDSLLMWRKKGMKDSFRVGSWISHFSQVCLCLSLATWGRSLLAPTTLFDTDLWVQALNVIGISYRIYLPLNFPAKDTLASLCFLFCCTFNLLSFFVAIFPPRHFDSTSFDCQP